MARTWGDGLGAQCSKRPSPNGSFCPYHEKAQGTGSWHGALNEEIPERKRSEFTRRCPTDTTQRNIDNMFVACSAVHHGFGAASSNAAPAPVLAAPALADLAPMEAVASSDDAEE